MQCKTSAERKRDKESERKRERERSTSNFSAISSTVQRLIRVSLCLPVPFTTHTRHTHPIRVTVGVTGNVRDVCGRQLTTSQFGTARKNTHLLLVNFHPAHLCVCFPFGIFNQSLRNMCKQKR